MRNSMAIPLDFLPASGDLAVYLGRGMGAAEVASLTGLAAGARRGVLRRLWTRERLTSVQCQVAASGVDRQAHSGASAERPLLSATAF